MPSINMIAPRRADKRRLERDMRRLVIVIIAELVFAVGLGGWVCTKLYTTRSHIADMDVQLAKLQPVVKQIEQYQSSTDRLKPKLELLSKAKDGTMRWYNTLDKLTQSLPTSTYLTRVATTVRDDKQSSSTTVNLTGISSAQEKVGETMMRLYAIPDFESVELHFTQQAGGRTGQGIEFEVGAVMKGGNAEKGAQSNGPGES